MEHLESTAVNAVLKLKRFWRGLFGKGLWSEILKAKYIKKYSIEEWIRDSRKSVCNGSIYWIGFIQHYPWLGRWLS